MTKKKYPYETVKEFVCEFLAEERGRISTYKHIMKMCEVSINAHKKMAKKKYVQKIAENNSHLIRELNNDKEKI